MQLARIAVRNIRSYPSAELALGPGTTLLVGDVGAGKTSLLYAVEMALFGFAEFDASFLIRHGARDAEVALTLEGDGHSYTISRRFRRREVRGRDAFQLESSSYAEDGALRRYSATELRQRVIELLGFPDNPNPRAHSDLWRWAVYVPQERMRMILEQKPSERLETVRKALGLEQYRIARENAQLVAAELVRRADRHAAQAGELQRSAGELERWTTELATATDGLATAQAERAEVLTSLESADAEVARVEALRQRESSLVQRRGELTRRLDEVAAARAVSSARLLELAGRERDLDARAAREPTLRAEWERLEGEVVRLQRGRETVQRQRVDVEEAHRAYAAAEVEVRSLRESLDRLRKDRDQAESDWNAAAARSRELHAQSPVAPIAPASTGPIELLREALRQAQRTLDQAQAAFAVAEAELRELDSLQREGVCPRCHQPVRAQEFRTHVAEAARAVAETRDAVQAAARARAEGEQAVQARQDADRAEERWAHQAALAADASTQESAARQRIDLLGQRIGDGETALAAVQGRTARLQDTPGLLRSIDQQLAEQDQELFTLEGRRTRASNELVQLRTQLEGRPGLQHDFDLARAEAQRLQNEGPELQTHRAEIEGSLRDLATEVTRLPELIASRRRAVERRAALDQRIGSLERQLGHAREARAISAADAERRERLLGDVEEERSVARWFLGEFRDALAALEQRLLARAQQEFQTALARYFRALVDDPSMQARCDGSFSPAVELDGEWTPPEALSGGERTALALAYRLALGQVVRSFGELTLTTLILDEPTDGFSPEQVGRMGELLDELRLPQVLLVSHEASLGSAADRVVRIRRTADGSTIEEDPTTVPRTRPAATEPVPPPAAARPRGRRRTLEEAAR